MIIFSLFKGFWKCEGSTGLVFSEVELMGGEWADYDEKVISFILSIMILTYPSLCQAKLPIQISAFESQWTRA